MSINKTHAVSAIRPAEPQLMQRGLARHLKPGASEQHSAATHFTLSQAMTALRTHSGQDIRSEKVDALRESISSGTYRADSSKIAAGLLRTLSANGPDED